MRIAVLQLAPRIGDVEANIAQADQILVQQKPHDFDVLVLPELAFTGYNFPDLKSISPYLEPTASGVSTIWAKDVAQRLKCHVIVGYPEVSTEVDEQGRSVNYNSTVTVDPEGHVLATYRKSHLYYTDESWAAEGSGFFFGKVGTLGEVAHGICMDINPKEFEAAWDAYEFASHCKSSKAQLVVLSTAWLTHTPLEILQANPTSPDIGTLGYWIERLKPLSDLAEGEAFTVVFANRCGSEPHQVQAIHTRNGKKIDWEDVNANYAGSSCVMRFDASGVSIHDMLGQHEEGLLIVDTELNPKYVLRHRAEEEEQAPSGPIT